MTSITEKNKNELATKVCNKCGLEKSLDSFYKEERRKDGHNSTCKVCLSEYKKSLISKNQQKNSSIKEKVCTKCKLLKDLDDFHMQALGKGGRSSQCKQCTSKYDKERSLKNIEDKVCKKQCSICKQVKSSGEFPLNPHHKHGLNSSCKDCHNEYRKRRWWENREHELKRSRKYYLKNKKKRCASMRKKWHENRDKQLERSRRYYQSHKKERSEYTKKWRVNRPEICREVNRKWRIKNKEKTRFYSFKYRSAKLLATPPWINENHEKQMSLMYVLAKSLEVNTEGRFEVDHIIPLCGENFCGLNVPWNLQVISASQNRSKGNKLIPELGLTAC